MSLPLERCSTTSVARREPQAGTASSVRRWMLLQHDGPWGDRPMLDARLPSGVGARLDRVQHTLGIRVLLIRRPDRDATDAGTCFLISSGPREPRIERTFLDAPGDVLELDLEAASRGRSLGLEPYDGPLFLVCTHGRHDPCCAERGRPVAEALSGSHPIETWESTHVGGDRFAANVIAFPHGWYFGRVEADAAASVAGAYAGGRIDLDHARGRSCYPIDVQSAELFLRRERGLDGLDDIGVRRVERASAITTVAFETDADVLRVSVERGDAQPARLTCHARDERRAPRFRLVSIESRPRA
jgi:hypothetical protein